MLYQWAPPPAIVKTYDIFLVQPYIASPSSSSSSSFSFESESESDPESSGISSTFSLQPLKMFLHREGITKLRLQLSQHLPVKFIWTINFNAFNKDV